MDGKRQGISLAVFICYMLSVALLVGELLRTLPTAADSGRYLFSWLYVLCHGLFLFGLAQPARRKKLLALAIFLECMVRWCYYCIMVGSLAYGLMSYSVDLYADAVLIAFILSTKRGPVLKTVTVSLLGIRLAELILGLFVSFVPPAPLLLQAPGGQDGLSVRLLLELLLQFAAFFMLPAVLRLPKTKEAEEMPLDESLFSCLEQEKTRMCCTECGQELLHDGTCAACGKTPREDKEILYGFQWPESMKNTCEKLKAGRWDEAVGEFERFLEKPAEKTFACLGLLLAELQYAEAGQLWEQPIRLEMQPLWQQAANCAEGELKTQLIRMRRMVYNRYEQKRKQEAYVRAEKLRDKGDAESVLESARSFYCLGGFEDASAQAVVSLNIAEQKLFESAQKFEQAQEYEKAIRLYKRLPRHKEAATRAAACEEALCRRSSALYPCGTGGKIALLLAGLLFTVAAYLGF